MAAQPRASHARRRNQGGNPKLRFVPKSQSVSSDSHFNSSFQQLSIHEEVRITQGLDPKNKKDSELKNEVGNEREESDDVDDLDEEEGDGVFRRLDRLRREKEEIQLSEELISVNDQLQQDEVVTDHDHGQFCHFHFSKVYSRLSFFIIIMGFGDCILS